VRHSGKFKYGTAAQSAMLECVTILRRQKCRAQTAHDTRGVAISRGRVCVRCCNCTGGISFNCGAEAASQRPKSQIVARASRSRDRLAQRKSVQKRDPPWPAVDLGEVAGEVSCAARAGDIQVDCCWRQACGALIYRYVSSCAGQQFGGCGAAYAATPVKLDIAVVHCRTCGAVAANGVAVEVASHGAAVVDLWADASAARAKASCAKCACNTTLRAGAATSPTVECAVFIAAPRITFRTLAYCIECVVRPAVAVLVVRRCAIAR
jgi:hypothetical protein